MATSSKGSIRIDLSWKAAWMAAGLLFLAGLVFATVERAERMEITIGDLSEKVERSRKHVEAQIEWIENATKFEAEKNAGLPRDVHKIEGRLDELNKRLDSIVKVVEKNKKSAKKDMEAIPDNMMGYDKKLADLEAEIKKVLGVVKASNNSLIAQANVATQHAAVINKQAKAIDKLLTIHKISADEAIK